MTTVQRNDTEEELGYPTEAHGRIPSFANRDEEAVFWETHDVTEFVSEELRTVEVIIGGELSGVSRRSPEGAL